MNFNIEKLEQQEQPIAPLIIVGGIILVAGGAGVGTGYLINK